MKIANGIICTGVLLCGVLLASPGSVAQQELPPPSGQQGPPPPPGNRGPEQRLQRMQQELNLTPDQTEKVRSIFAADREKFMAIRNDSSLSQEDRRDKMMKLQHEQNDKVKAVLDDSQKAKFDQMQTRMRDRMGRPGAGAPPPAPGENVPAPPPPGSTPPPPPQPGSNTPPPPPPPGAETTPPAAPKL